MTKTCLKQFSGNIGKFFFALSNISTWPKSHIATGKCSLLLIYWSSMGTMKRKFVKFSANEGVRNFQFTRQYKPHQMVTMLLLGHDECIPIDTFRNNFDDLIRRGVIMLRQLADGPHIDHLRARWATCPAIAGTWWRAVRGLSEDISPCWKG